MLSQRETFSGGGMLSIKRRFSNPEAFCTSLKTFLPGHPTHRWPECRFLGSASSWPAVTPAIEVVFCEALTAINIQPHSKCFFLFGHSPNTTSYAQVRFYWPASYVWNCLLPVNGSPGSIDPSPDPTLAGSLITFYFCCVLSYRIGIVSLAPKLSVLVCKLYISMLLNYH